MPNHTKAAVDLAETFLTAHRPIPIVRWKRGPVSRELTRRLRVWWVVAFSVLGLCIGHSIGTMFFQASQSARIEKRPIQVDSSAEPSLADHTVGEDREDSVVVGLRSPLIINGLLAYTIGRPCTGQANGG